MRAIIKIYPMVPLHAIWRKKRKKKETTENYQKEREKRDGRGSTYGHPILVALDD
jgi:hypothetical protein